MSDGEPEPFVMSTDPDDPDGSTDEAGPATPDDTDDPEPGAALPVESIADLIDEASRTAAEQAVQAAIGEAPEDRSAEVWGPADDDTEAVWDAAAEHHSGNRVFDDVLGTDDAWSSSGDRQVSPAADPTVDLADGAGDEDDEPEVYTFPVADEPSVVAADDLAAAMVAPDSPGASDEVDGDQVSADAGEDAQESDDLAVLDEVIEADEDTWADQAWSDRVEQADAAADEPTVETPEPFLFAAGPDTNAPADVPDHTATNDEREPDAFSFAFDAPDAPDEEPAMEPTTPADPDPTHDAAVGDGAGDATVDPWAAAAEVSSPDSDEPAEDADTMWSRGTEESADTVWIDPAIDDAGAVWEDEGSAAADDVVWAAGDDDAGDEPMASADQDDPGTDAVSDDAWIFDVGDDEGDDGAGPVDDSLAATATPRPDTGWNDLESEQASWSLPDLPRRAPSEGAEPDGFAASLDDGFSAGDDDDDDDDAPWSSPALDDPEPVAHAEAEDLQGALGELLGATSAPGPVEAETPDEPAAPAADDTVAPAASSAPLDHLDDLDDLDGVLADLDGLGEPTAGAPPTGDDDASPFACLLYTSPSPRDS